MRSQEIDCDYRSSFLQFIQLAPESADPAEPCQASMRLHGLNKEKSNEHG